MLLPQTSVASVLNPRISGGAQMTEERGEGEESERQSGVVDTTERSRERERERMKRGNGEEKTCERPDPKGKK